MTGGEGSCGQSQCAVQAVGGVVHDELPYGTGCTTSHEALDVSVAQRQQSGPWFSARPDRHDLARIARHGNSGRG